MHGLLIVVNKRESLAALHLAFVNHHELFASPKCKDQPRNRIVTLLRNDRLVDGGLLSLAIRRCYDESGSDEAGRCHCAHNPQIEEPMRSGDRHRRHPLAATRIFHSHYYLFAASTGTEKAIARDCQTHKSRNSWKQVLHFNKIYGIARDI